MLVIGGGTWNASRLPMTAWLMVENVACCRRKTNAVRRHVIHFNERFDNAYQLIRTKFEGLSYTESFNKARCGDWHHMSTALGRSCREFESIALALALNHAKLDISRHECERALKTFASTHRSDDIVALDPETLACCLFIAVGSRNFARHVITRYEIVACAQTNWKRDNEFKQPAKEEAQVVVLFRDNDRHGPERSKQFLSMALDIALPAEQTCRVVSGQVYEYLADPANFYEDQQADVRRYRSLCLVVVLKLLDASLWIVDSNMAKFVWV